MATKKVTINGKRIEGSEWLDKDTFVVYFEADFSEKTNTSREMFAEIHLNEDNKVLIGANVYDNFDGSFIDAEYYYGTRNVCANLLSKTEISSIVEYIKKEAGININEAKSGKNAKQENKLNINGQRIESEAWHDNDNFVVTFQKVGYKQMFAAINRKDGKIKIGADLDNQNHEYMQTEYYYGTDDDITSELSVKEINSIIDYLHKKVEEYKGERELEFKQKGAKKCYVVLHTWKSNDSADSAVIAVYWDWKDALKRAKLHADAEKGYSMYDKKDIQYNEDKKNGIFKLEYTNGNFDTIEVVESAIK